MKRKIKSVTYEKGRLSCKKLDSKKDKDFLGSDFITKLLMFFSGVTVMMLLFIGGYAYYYSKNEDTNYKTLAKLYSSNIAKYYSPIELNFLSTINGNICID